MGLTVLGEPGNVYAFVCAVGGGEEAGKYKKTRPGWQSTTTIMYPD